MSTHDIIDDLRAGCAFEGQSTRAQRLEYRIGGLGYELRGITQTTMPGIPSVIAKAEELIRLLRELERERGTT